MYDKHNETVIQFLMTALNVLIFSSHMWLETIDSFDK